MVGTGQAFPAYRSHQRLSPRRMHYLGAADRQLSLVPCDGSLLAYPDIYRIRTLQNRRGLRAFGHQRHLDDHLLFRGRSRGQTRNRSG